MKCFKLGHFTISWKTWAHCQFDGSSSSQKSWDRGNKKLKVTRTKKKQLEEQLIRLFGKKDSSKVKCKIICIFLRFKSAWGFFFFFFFFRFTVFVESAHDGAELRNQMLIIPASVNEANTNSTSECTIIITVSAACPNAAIQWFLKYCLSLDALVVHLPANLPVTSG